ncbi:MAG: TIGR02453 family protein [Pseudopedobacter saltans]|uniref:TIGR02453 family protein n=1 Tax=Pseudopedobacter saltans TaxID=151895 RepID=A0A2W5EYA8_9SPHI|nr:MAG: TIGR02453 family protein [Pseudopedobacter saltans]
MLQKSTLQFLKNIKKSNHKDWMDAHRSEYEAAKKDFAQLIEKIISIFGKKDAEIAHLTASSCTFRFNRDIRFSKDKSPYKTNFGASINKGGKKAHSAGYYLHLEPGNSFCGGGIWMPESKDLAAVRQEIDYNWEEFEKIVKNKTFTKTYGSLSFAPEYVLIREPKGYEKDNPAIEYLKLKSFLALKDLPDDLFVSDKIEKEVVDAFSALQPLIIFMNRALDD